MFSLANYFTDSKSLSEFSKLTWTDIDRMLRSIASYRRLGGIEGQMKGIEVRDALHDALTENGIGDDGTVTISLCSTALSKLVIVPYDVYLTCLNMFILSGFFFVFLFFVVVLFFFWKELNHNNLSNVNYQSAVLPSHPPI